MDISVRVLCLKVALLAMGMFLVSGCSSPTYTFNRKSSDLSGTYTIHSLDDVKPYQLPNPFIDFSLIQIPSQITVSQVDDSEVTIQYQTNDGRTQVLSEEIVKDDNVLGWHEGMLIYQTEMKLTGAPILPGHAKCYRITKFYLDEKGDLQVDGSVIESGFALFVYPFRDQYDYSLTLQSSD